MATARDPERSSVCESEASEKDKDDCHGQTARGDKSRQETEPITNGEKGCSQEKERMLKENDEDDSEIFEDALEDLHDKNDSTKVTEEDCGGDKSGEEDEDEDEGPEEENLTDEQKGVFYFSQKYCFPCGGQPV